MGGKQNLTSAKQVADGIRSRETARIPHYETMLDVVSGVDADYRDERSAAEWVDVGGES